MSDDVKGTTTHQQLITLLTQQGARFRVMEHDAVGKCEAVSEIRGTDLGQGAKALVCKVKGNGVKKHVLAILAADLQADLSQLASRGDKSVSRKPCRSRYPDRLRFWRHSAF